MQAGTRILTLLAICCLSIVPFHTEAVDGVEGLDDSTEGAVTMELVALEVGESSLALSYNIINGMDRDAWVCSSIGFSEPFEVFLKSDKQTLLIRKRLDVPTTVMWRPPGPVGAYARIAPGASLADSVQIAVPVSPRFLYASQDGTELAQTVTGLALEIGYYDADLPGIIRGVIDVAEKSGLTIHDVPGGLLDTYFRGVRLRYIFSDFDLVNEDPYGQGCVLIKYSYQALTDEKVLRVEVNDVSIPYEGYSEK